VAVAAEPRARRDVPEVQPVPQWRQRVPGGEPRFGSVERRLQGDAALATDRVAARLAATDPVLEVLVAAVDGVTLRRAGVRRPARD
jgi:hypothetical protein